MFFTTIRFFSKSGKCLGGITSPNGSPTIGDAIDAVSTKFHATTDERPNNKIGRSKIYETPFYTFDSETGECVHYMA